MVARHCSDPTMVSLIEYGISVGSNSAKKQKGAVGFIGSSTQNNAHYFNTKDALGTIPHSLIGFYGSTLKSAQEYYKTLQPDTLSVFSRLLWKRSY